MGWIGRAAAGTAALASIVMTAPAGAMEAAPGQFRFGAPETAKADSWVADGRLSKALGLRLDMAWLDFGPETGLDVMRQPAGMPALTAGPVLDFYPDGGKFRLSGSMRLERQALDDSSRQPGLIAMGDRAFQPAGPGTIDLSGRFNDVAYYVGVGYTEKVAKRLNLFLDLGAVYQGTPDAASLGASALAPPEGMAALDGTGAKDDVDGLRFKFLVMKVTMKYRF
jgi:hypothetical protein